MLLKNVDVGRGLVNGARGVVVGFAASEDWPEWGPLPRVAFSAADGRTATRLIEPQVAAAQTNPIPCTQP
jgi:hypothetical protein